jgi:hypothetical protein
MTKKGINEEQETWKQWPKWPIPSRWMLSGFVIRVVSNDSILPQRELRRSMHDTERRGKIQNAILEVVLAPTDFAHKNTTYCV